jgi:hypothetical protein
MLTPRGTQRYQPTQHVDEDALTRATIALASQYRRFGYRRITVECARSSPRRRAGRACLMRVAASLSQNSPNFFSHPRRGHHGLCAGISGAHQS